MPFDTPFGKIEGHHWDGPHGQHRAYNDAVEELSQRFMSFFDGKISDGLKRDYLPAPYNTYSYPNSRPDNRPDLPFV